MGHIADMLQQLAGLRGSTTQQLASMMAQVTEMQQRLRDVIAW